MRVLGPIFIAITAGIAVLPAKALAVVLVVGGGAAAQCYSTAEFGDVDKAFDICTRALADQNLSVRDRAATFVNRSVVRLRARDYSGALADCDQSIARVPAIGEAYVNRGAALINMNRPADAVTELDKAIRLGLDKIQLAYYNRGLAREKLNDPKGAYADYKKALEIDPTLSLAADELKRFTTTGESGQS